MLTVDLDSPLPLNEQLVRGLRRAIAVGELAPGQDLPSVRQLAADLGVNLNTVARAYRSLEEDGLVHSARGRGTRVTANRESRNEAPALLEQRFIDKLQDVLSDAKLAGMKRARVMQRMQREVDKLWPAGRARNARAQTDTQAKKGVTR